MTSSSTLAEPSAADLAGLISRMDALGLCTIFSEVSVSEALARTVASELGRCDEVRLVPLYTGSLGAPGSGADNYIGMMRANIDAIAGALR
jgi:ABC-type Zn uptake system ZnuABC Zn-binding protein ZnuA